MQIEFATAAPLMPSFKPVMSILSKKIGAVEVPVQINGGSARNVFAVSDVLISKKPRAEISFHSRFLSLIIAHVRKNMVWVCVRDCSHPSCLRPRAIKPLR